MVLQVCALAVLLLQTSLSGTAQPANNSASAAALQFTSGQSASRIPFEFISNHIYVRARLNGSEPLWFLLDTGATASYFDAQRATALGLTS
ncbi:MAG TPA: retropepsin-like aspartic protease, partial [Pyrinomonadaceae bacterium]|nr:retropepsin-like aspartic protease [Pyrinomonadaceae bacterium]